MMPIDKPKDWLGEAKAAAADLRADLLRRMIPADISPRLKTPFKVQLFRELLLHRLSDLAEAACKLYDEGRGLPAIVLTRAAFETMAMLYYLLKQVDEAVTEQSAQKLDDGAMRGLFGSKNQASALEAVNVLTVIKHVEKQYPGIQEMFADLCEFAHPNYMGVMAMYHEMPNAPGDPREARALGPNAMSRDPGSGTICLTVALGFAMHYAKRLIARDPDVLRLCELDPDDAQN
jgi:hypothetical protein